MTDAGYTTCEDILPHKEVVDIIYIIIRVRVEPVGQRRYLMHTLLYETLFKDVSTF